MNFISHRPNLQLHLHQSCPAALVELLNIDLIEKKIIFHVFNLTPPYSVFVAMFYHHSYSDLYSLVKQRLQPSFVLSVPLTINVDRRNSTFSLLGWTSQILRYHRLRLFVVCISSVSSSTLSLSARTVQVSHVACFPIGGSSGTCKQSWLLWSSSFFTF